MTRMFRQRVCLPLPNRLWPKVDIRSEDECWEWNAAKTRFGYGYLSIGRRDEGLVLAHRAVWELTHGPLPNGMKVCHTCDNPSCCNPSHLFTGTQADNLTDCKVKGRARGGSLPGSRNPNSKLSDNQINEIRERYDSGKVLQRVLAHEYGITQTQVSAIILHKSWGRQ